MCYSVQSGTMPRTHDSKRRSEIPLCALAWATGRYNVEWVILPLGPSLDERGLAVRNDTHKTTYGAPCVNNHISPMSCAPQLSSSFLFYSYVVSLEAYATWISQTALARFGLSQMVRWLNNKYDWYSCWSRPSRVRT